MVEYTSSKDFNVKQYADEGGGGMVHYKVIAAAVKLLKRSEKMCAKALRNCAYEKERADKLSITAARLKTELETQDNHHGRNQVRKAKLDNFARANLPEIGKFCSMMFAYYKIWDKTWSLYLPLDPNSFYSKISPQLDFPDWISKEHYWIKQIVPLINGKMCDKRSDATKNVKKGYLGML